MAATELRSVQRRGTVGRRPPASASAAWLHAYAGIWAGTFVAAGVVALAGPVLVLPVRRVLGLALSPQRHPPPQLGHILTLAAHNIPIAAWPLLLGLAGAERSPISRRLADCGVLACILANTVPVGAALAAYGTPLLAYVPQLPLEWAALALGYSSWLVQRKRRLSVAERLVWLAAIAGSLMCAAALETLAVPHR